VVTINEVIVWKIGGNIERRVIMNFEIIEARYKLITGIGCDGSNRGDDVVCKAWVGPKKALYFFYSSDCGGLYGVSDVNLFLKKYGPDKDEPPLIDFFMDGYSSFTEHKLSDSEYYPIFLALERIAKATLI